MNKRQCVSCGAPIEPGAHKCSYCGMTYDDGYWTGLVKYVPLHMNRHRLVAQVSIPEQICNNVDADCIASYTKNDLVTQLAAGLSELMTIRTSRDYMKDVVIVRGEIWVEEPFYGRD